MPRIYMYTLYERIWHWAQALAIILLLITGIEIHWSGHFHLFGYAAAVKIHTPLGFILLLDAFLALFYHVTTGEIHQYLPEPQGFISLAGSQARYYLYGIFRGEPHPIEKNPERKLNPLQKITYLMILNVFLPLQIATGILIWGSEQFSFVRRILGGLPVLVPIHVLIAWFLGAFMLLHIYLTTTGRSPLANIRAMLSGWEESETESTDEW